KTPVRQQVAPQLAASRHAEYAAVRRPRRPEKWRRRYRLPAPLEQEMAVPVPDVAGGLAFMVTPESGEAHPIRCDEQVFRYFLHALECFRWVQHDSKEAMAPPLEVP